MKNTWSLIGLVFAAATVVSAQDYPRAETFFGYTYMRANSASNVPSFSANGGSGQVAVNFNKWVGFVMDVGAVHNGNISDVHLDSTFTNFLFGPRISFRKSRVRPYFNVLFGGVHAGTSIAVSAVPVATPVYTPGVSTPTEGQAVTLRATASQTSFAMATGVGIDIKINRHLSFRPIGLDYFMTRLQNFRSAEDNNQHNLRYTAGFNFTFGGEAPSASAARATKTHASLLGWQSGSRGCRMSEAKYGPNAARLGSSFVRELRSTSHLRGQYLRAPIINGPSTGSRSASSHPLSSEPLGVNPAPISWA